MESRRGKRKSPSQGIIFEVSDDDISPEPSDNECSEPNAKILKTDGNIFHSISSGDSNLESEKHNLSPEVSQKDDTVIIIDTNSFSNNSTIEIYNNSNDIIDITTDDTSTPNVNVEVCTEPEEDSTNVEIVVVDVDNSKTSLSPLKEDDFNLEDGELQEISNKVEKNQSTEIEQDQLDDSKTPPCICITFRDDKIAELYKSRFVKYLQTFVDLEVKSFDGLTINVERDSDLDPNEWVVLDETICISDVKELAKEEILAIPILAEQKSPSKKKRKKKNKKEKELFILDTNPSVDEIDGPCAKYSTKFQIDSQKSTPENEGEVKMSAQTCFNCEGNHAIKDCPLPKNFSKINAARQRFKAQKQTSRYHLEEDQKYSHLKPGHISDKLRDALGLRSNQLPPFIYQMRILGYPPGWLEEAKFVHSNLEMFDSEGNNVRAAKRKQQGLDPEKIVDYPGFNVPPPEDKKDEHRQYRVPPFSEKFSKQAMIEFFEKQYAKQQDDFETYDMDLDASFEENKEKLVKVSEEIAVVNPLLNRIKEIDSNLASPSLTDLEKAKETLLAALDDNSSSNPKSVETASGEPENESEITLDVTESKTDVSTDRNLSIDIEKAQDSSTSFSSPPLSGGINNVKTSMFGTPILKSSSPYSSLPNADNFMKDVSPVINFENLPNSTGKYEQMTEVLQKVRSTLRKNLQNCKS